MKMNETGGKGKTAVMPIEPNRADIILVRAFLHQMSLVKYVAKNMQLLNTFLLSYVSTHHSLLRSDLTLWL